MSEENQSPAGTSIQSGLVSSIGRWYQHPFNAEGSVFNWALFLGMLIIVAFLWQIILVRYINLPEILGE